MSCSVGGQCPRDGDPMCRQCWAWCDCCDAHNDGGNPIQDVEGGVFSDDNRTFTCRDCIRECVGVAS